jgi:hypothetical protein
MKQTAWMALALSAALTCLFPHHAYADPVTYEVGGTFAGVGDPDLVAAFDGNAYTFRFTYDADNIQTLIYAPNEIGIYSGAYTNFRFSTTVGGQPYVFETQDFFNTLQILNNTTLISSSQLDAATVVSYAGITPSNLPDVDPLLEVNGYLPYGVYLSFVSFLDLNGQNGLDFLTSIDPIFDPIALASDFNFGSYINDSTEPGHTYQTFAISFVPTTGLAFDEFGMPNYSNIFSDFSYIRIVDNPAAAVAAPPSLVALAMGLALMGYRARRRFKDI